MKQIITLSKYGLIVALIIVAAACTKKEQAPPEPTIVIDIQSPVEGAVFASGDTVKLLASISSPVDLHGYEWRIKDKQSGAELKLVTEHAHGRQISISGVYVNTVSAGTQAELEIVAEIDHEGDEARKSLSITLN